MRKRAVAVFFVIIGMAALYIAFGTDKPAQTLREGISMSLDEDFKIKESLGKILLVEDKNESVAVSGNVEILTMAYPVNGEMSKKENMGEECLVFDCRKFSGVRAVADGTVEKCEKDKITLRHGDGKLSVYTGVGCLCREGQNVSKGDIVGYAKEDVVYRLYDKCNSIDPSIYFPEQ